MAGGWGGNVSQVEISVFSDGRREQGISVILTKAIGDFNEILNNCENNFVLFVGNSIIPF